MSDKPNLRSIAADPAEYLRWFYVDTPRGLRPLAEVGDAWQLADHQAMNDALRYVASTTKSAGKPPTLKFYLERPRGHDKTGTVARITAWLAAFSKRRLLIVIGSGDKEQAKLIRDDIDRAATNNPHLRLRDALDVQQWRIVNERIGTEVAVLSSDAATSYGLTPDVILLDEVTHWRSRELFDSLISASAKRGGACLVVIISNAGTGQGESWQWQVREHARTSPDWHFNSLPGPIASWIDPARLAEQEKLLPRLPYERLWLNRWTTGSGDALPEDFIKRALTLNGPADRPEHGWVYHAGLDMGWSRDPAALVVVGVHVGGYSDAPAKPKRYLTTTQRALIDLGYMPEPIDEEGDAAIWTPGSARVRLVATQLWRPAGACREVDAAAIERTLFALADRFNLASVSYDPYELRAKAQEWRRRGLPLIEVPFTGGNLTALAQATIEPFSAGTIDLYPCPNLLHDLANAQCKEASYGVRLTFPRDANGHGDMGTAFSLALYGASRGGYGAPNTIQGPLLCWP